MRMETDGQMRAERGQAPSASTCRGFPGGPRLRERPQMASWKHPVCEQDWGRV